MAPSRRTVNLLGAIGVALADGQAQQMREASGLDDSEVAALNVVANGTGAGISIGELRVALGLTHPGAVRVVDRLAAKGLVVRSAGRDGRTKALRPTTEGERSVSAMRLARVRWLTPLAAVLTSGPGADASLLERLLVRATGTEDEAEHLCRLCDETACPQSRCPVTLAVS